MFSMPSQALSHFALQALLFSSTVFSAPQSGSPVTLEECIEAAGIPNAFSSDPNWAASISPWQLRIKPIPSGVIFPTSHAQIAAGLKCAVDRGIKVNARGGGHSYGSYGMGGNDGSLVINMAEFNSTVYNPTTKLLTYGGGSTVGPTATWLWNNHGLHFPHVRANLVGLAGSSFGGGFGSTSRFLGTPMDYVTSVQYMLWNGKIVNASRTQNKNLFWAFQGAGSSFGILLTLTTKTWQPTYPDVTQYTINVGSVDIDAGVKALLSIQKYALSGKAPDTLSLRWQLTAPPYSGAGFYYGDPSTFDTIIAPLLADLPATTTVTKAVLPFWESENASTPGINTTVNTYPPRNFYVQALILRTQKPFTYASAYALYNYTTYAFNRTDMTKFGFIDLWGGKVIREIEDSATAFAHHNSLFLIRWEGRLAAGLTTFPADGIAYLQNQLQPFKDQLAKERIPLRGFVNYRDTALTLPEWSKRLFANNWPKLLRIKKTIDPHGVFTANSQDIPVV